MLSKDHWGSTDVASVFNAPESDIFLSTGDQTRVVSRRELDALDVVFTGLLCGDERLLLLMKTRDIPNYNHFSYSLASSGVLLDLATDTGHEIAIGAESQALDLLNWECHHGKAARSVVIPNSDNTLVAFLCRGDKTTALADVKAFDCLGVAKEKPLLDA